jgi:hypothetical protein
VERITENGRTKIRVSLGPNPPSVVVAAMGRKQKYEYELDPNDSEFFHERMYSVRGCDVKMLDSADRYTLVERTDATPSPLRPGHSRREALSLLTTGNRVRLINESQIYRVTQMTPHQVAGWSTTEERILCSFSLPGYQRSASAETAAGVGN